MLEFQFEPKDSTLHCNFKGRMDSPTSMEIEKTIMTKLEETLASTPRDKLNIIFDLADVDYIASAFIRICLQTAKSSEHGRFAVKNTNPFVMKIFKMAGLDKELNVS